MKASALRRDIKLRPTTSPFQQEIAAGKAVKIQVRRSAGIV